VITSGDAESGFSVESTAVTLRVRAWGFWDVSTAAAFAPSVLAELRTSPRRHVVVDATQLKPQREEGQSALRDVVAGVSKLGAARAEILLTNAITKMQLARIIRELGDRVWRIDTPTPTPSADGG
jgi:hypothetical protein